MINFFNRVKLRNFFSRVNRGFNTHFVCYIFQFVCVRFAARRHRPIAVEC